MGYVSMGSQRVDMTEQLTPSPFNERGREAGRDGDMDGGRKNGRTGGLERSEKAFWLPCWENAAGFCEALNSVGAEAPSEKPSRQEERREASLLKWLEEEWESSGLSGRLERGPSLRNQA